MAEPATHCVPNERPMIETFKPLDHLALIDLVAAAL